MQAVFRATVPPLDYPSGDGTVGEDTTEAGPGDVTQALREEEEADKGDTVGSREASVGDEE